MNDLTPYLVDEFLEDYEQGRLTRRDALRLIGGMTGVALAAQMIDARAQTSAPAMMVPAAAAMRVAADDPAVVAGPVKFPGGDGELLGYLARPNKPGRFPIVLVCHENRGLTPHFEDVSRRLAKAGYVALTLDLLSRDGGTATLNGDAIPGLLGKAPQGQAVADFQSALKYAQAQPFARPDRAGIVGFCFGGGVVWRVAAATPDVRALVPFYGLPAQAADVPKLNAAVLAIYAGRDERINANIPAIEAAMQANGKTFRKIVYPDVDHAFYNDTGTRYAPDASKAAWDETLAWFGKYLS
ncbi:MAG TPA: dienelactone hydrolase family protein [Casimicrobiaceae bacterium]|nr:dienelactone hydrolase family protein [Casimicrobiaceae bacterium]